MYLAHDMPRLVQQGGEATSYDIRTCQRLQRLEGLLVRYEYKNTVSDRQDVLSDAKRAPLYLFTGAA